MGRVVVMLTLSGLGATTAAQFPAPFTSGAAPHHERLPMSGEEAAQTFSLPDDFAVELLAAEPVLRNPIAMAWDARGRLWIAENFTYSERGVKFESSLRDRVIVFEPDGSTRGRLRAPRVFHDGLHLLTSVEVGRGGVWLMCPPQLLYFPDAVPDGPARVVLDGFTVSEVGHHNCANGLRSGPDGGFYWRCGGASPAEVGAPHTPAS